MRWLLLFCALLICFAVASLGARWTTPEIAAWYQTLVRPTFAPPNWIFAPVWSMLYLLMAVAVWRVALLPSSTLRTAALALFCLQLLLNLCWSCIFFHWHQIGMAFVEVLLLWASIAATTLLFARLLPLAAWLMVPYLLWVSFASLLNFAYWRLN